ncbi:MAG: potassium channel family protein [Planctomycetota bacterium]
MRLVRRYPNSTLLVFLLIFFVLQPIVTQFPILLAALIIDGSFILIFVAALNAESERISWRDPDLWLVIASTVLRLTVTLRVGDIDAGPYRNLIIWTEIFSGIVLFRLCGTLLRNIRKSPRVRFDTIACASAVYILIALAFTNLYIAAWVQETGDGAFNGVEAWEGGQFEDSTLRKWGQSFAYFSVVTQTTLGYGDITPRTSITRGLVMLQTVVGQLYLAILLALLVAVWLAQRQLDDQVE